MDSWSPDGKFLLYSTRARLDIWVLPLEGERSGASRKPFPFARESYEERYAKFSPDGHWVAYVSNQSRRNEIYVAPFPGPGGKRQVSLEGGDYPRWRRDGKEIFYLSPDGHLMATEVTAKAAAIEIGATHTLFNLPTSHQYQYEVMPDGQRFLAAIASEGAAPTPITVVQNWRAGLKR